MNEEERRVINELLVEMRDSHKIIRFWLKGTPVEQTLSKWIKTLDSLLKKEVR